MNEAEGMKAQHFLELFPFKVDQATPLALVAAASLLVAAAQSLFSESLAEWGFSLSREKFEVDEDLPNFYSALKLS